MQKSETPVVVSLTVPNWVLGAWRVDACRGLGPSKQAGLKD